MCIPTVIVVLVLQLPPGKACAKVGFLSVQALRRRCQRMYSVHACCDLGNHWADSALGTCALVTASKQVVSL